MEIAVYDNDIITQHDFYNLCGTTLNEVSNKDYPNTNYFNPEIMCLDMDVYERRAPNNQPYSTMDAVIGMGIWNGIHLRSQKLVLIELRMNYKSPETLSCGSLINKDRHTRELLGYTQSIDFKSYFIFKDDVIQRFIRWFEDYKRENSNLKNCIPLSVKDFKIKFQNRQEYPYVPEIRKEDVFEKLQPLIDSTTIIDFCNSIKYWAGLSNDYGYRDKKEEEKIVRSAVIDAWKQFKDTIHVRNDDERLEIEIIEEDFSWILQSIEL